MNSVFSRAFNARPSSVESAGLVVPAVGIRSPAWVRTVRVATLAAGDITALTLSAIAAYAIWALPVKSQPVILYLDLFKLLPLFVGAYAVAGLYPGFGIGAVETLRRLSYQTSLVFVVLAAFSFVAKLPTTYSRMTFFIAWIISLFLIPVTRFAVLRVMKNRPWWGEAALLIGSGAVAARTIELLRNAHSLGYRPVATLGFGRTTSEPRERSVEECLATAPALAKEGVRVAIVADAVTSKSGRVISYLQEHFRHVIVIPSEDSLPVEGVVVRNLGGMLGLEFTNQLLLRRNMIMKRVLDIFIGGVAFVASLPILGTVIAAVMLVSRKGSPFYSQEREGLNGEPVKVWKVRSMYPDAEARLIQHLADNPEAKREWDEHCKLRNDPRILPFVGKFIRRFSLDELPQLWQVVKGELSLVGPRPFPEYHLRKFDPRFREFRRHVRPGLTGMWQISSRSDGGIEDQQRFDTHYIRNWSVWIDIYILARTAAVVLTGRGAF
jgi:Undecaprenyl-phosphate galactose phosphotransferase WbaP